MSSMVRKYFTAVVCPFTADGDIDEPGYRRLIQYYLQPRFLPVGGLLVNPAAGEIRVLGSPMRLSETPASQRTPPPTLGQNTDAVLRGDIGLDSDALDELRADGVI
jgi:hypothetical protein